MLDEQLVAEATALSGERTFSRTIERALAEMVRRLKARRLLEMKGSGIWQGQLSEMRGDIVSSGSPTSWSTGAGVREPGAVYRTRTRKPGPKR